MAKAEHDELVVTQEHDRALLEVEVVNVAVPQLRMTLELAKPASCNDVAEAHEAISPDVGVPVIVGQEGACQCQEPVPDAVAT